MGRLTELERRLGKISAQEARIDEEKARVSQQVIEELEEIDYRKNSVHSMTNAEVLTTSYAKTVRIQVRAEFDARGKWSWIFCRIIRTQQLRRFRETRSSMNLLSRLSWFVP